MRTPLRTASLLVVTALALSGCSAASATGPTSTPINTSAAVTVLNCDTTVRFDSAPKRVIAIKSTSTELLLALGLGDRIVGTAFQDGPVPAQWKAAAAGIPSLSDFVPSEEVALGKRPDLIFAGWESAFAADGVGTRAGLAALGVATYVSPPACRSVVPPKLTFDSLFADIEQVAAIFRVDGSGLVNDQKAKLAALTATAMPWKGQTALWYSSGTDTPYVGAGIGAPELVLETLGLKNIAGGVNASWASLGWEAIIAANPNVIVLVDATWNTANSKIAALEANPATKNLTAVKNHRYLVVPFAASEAGVRTVDATVDLAAQLKKLGG